GLGFHAQTTDTRTTAADITRHGDAIYRTHACSRAERFGAGRTLPEDAATCDLESRPPVAWPTSSMRHRHDQNAAGFNSVHHTEWKPAKKIPASGLVVRRPRFGQSLYRRFGRIHLLAEREGCDRTAFRIPACGGFSFLERLLEILK